MMSAFARTVALAMVISICSGASAFAATSPEASAPFERHGHIERFTIASKATNRTYTVQINRPASYEASNRAYPALFMLDGDYAFDAAVALSSYMQRGKGEISEHLIIGISNDVPFGEPLAARRTPDFTPPRKDGVMTRETVAPYYTFLRDEVLPQVERRVRIDPEQKTLWGYSLSGTFVTWLNYYDASLFQNYIIASPNWEQFGVQQRLMEGVVFKAPATARHKLFFSFDFGSELGGDPKMEGALKAFVDGGLPGYKTKFVTTRGETHTTSWFATLPAALRFIYGPD